MNLQGFWFALAAYSIWGFLPIYWKLLQHIPSFEILLHRMVWSLGFLLFLLFLSKDWQWLKNVLSEKKTLFIYLLAALLLGANWGIYIWAVNASFIVETSLGYFISPLVSVSVGVIFFRERLRIGQWLAVAIATIGVLILSFVYGRPPYIALSLAFTWNVYATLKKLAPLTSLRGLTLETALLFPLALSLLYIQNPASIQTSPPGVSTIILLIASGIVTATPLIFFTAAAKRLPLTMIGMMQYIAPTLQFIIGVFIYNEYFDNARLLGFAIIWASLIVFTFEGLRYRRKVHLAAA